MHAQAFPAMGKHTVQIAAHPADSPGRMFVAGALRGWLSCGTVYSVMPAHWTDILCIAPGAGA